MKNLLLITLMLSLFSCGGFQAQRVSGDESDEKSLEITDAWVTRDRAVLTSSNMFFMCIEVAIIWNFINRSSQINIISFKGNWCTIFKSKITYFF